MYHMNPPFLSQDPEAQNLTNANSSFFLCSTAGERAWQADLTRDPPACIQPASCLTASFENFFHWVAKEPVAGFFVVVFIFIIATILFVPGSILTIGAGTAFGASLGFLDGLLVGSLAVWVSAMAGATASMWLGRYVLQKPVSEYIRKYQIWNAV